MNNPYTSNGQQRSGQTTTGKAGQFLGSLEDPHNVITAENSILQNPNMTQMYPQGINGKDGSLRMELEPTLGVADLGSHKRPKQQHTSDSLSDTA